MTVRSIQREDAKDWVRMRKALWPQAELSNLTEEAEGFFSGRDPTHQMAVYVYERPNGKLGGFVEVGLRSVVDSAETSPVGYIEGWYVDPDLHRKGIGKALMRRAETWAKDMGCREMGSDAELNNDASHASHTALGFKETGRVVNFLKMLR